MKIRNTAALVLVAVLGACQSARVDWASSKAGSPIRALNLHQAGAALAGRVTLADGRTAPIRNIELEGDHLAFIVPAAEASFEGTRSRGGWSGQWRQGAASTPVALGAGRSRAAAGQPYAQPSQMVRLSDGREMHLDCRGAGAPVVVLDYGAGGTTADWKDVHDGLAKISRTCAYDRAGQGFSDPGPMPRDASAIASDMKAMLDASGEKGPYVLVGHSLGSLHVRLFADRYLKDVAGMVLVDPSGDRQRERLVKAVPKMAASQPNNDGLRRCAAAARTQLVTKDSETFRQCRQNDPDLIDSRISEAESMETTSSDATIAERRSYGDIPLLVLTRTDNAGAPPSFTPDDLAAYSAVWSQMHEEFALLSSAGVHRFVPGAGHYIQRDKPEAVVEAVRDVVEKARLRR